MSTRSSTRNLFPHLEDPERTIRRRNRVDPNSLNDFEEINMAANGNGDDGLPPAGGGLPVPDLRMMEELFQPTLNGQGGPIASIAIQETNFRLKNDMIQQVQNLCPFCGPGDDANKHLDKFLHVTQSMKVNGVSDDTLRLYLFPYSLQHRVAEWFDHLPRNSITTFDQMAKIFLGKYFPPSMVTKLRNDIMNFRQEPDESLFEAWEHTFYNGLTLRHRDTINAAAGGTFMKRRPEEYYDLIENMTVHHNDWETLAQQSESSSSITSSNPEIAALKLQMAEINKNLMKMLQTNQQVNSNMFSQFMKMNTASSSGSGTLPSNTVTNPREDLKGIITRSGVAYKGPTIPTTFSSSPIVVECETEVTKDTMPPTNNGSTEDVQSLVVQVETQVPNSKPVVAPVSAPKPNPKSLIPYPSRRKDQKLREKTNNQMEKFYQIFQDLRFDISFDQ
ncbi:reverse transcriptase domain-containing protein [Tanacetum coccineum]